MTARGKSKPEAVSRKGNERTESHSETIDAIRMTQHLSSTFCTRYPHLVNHQRAPSATLFMSVESPRLSTCLLYNEHVLIVYH